ncbi:MAG: LptF/LptG family permease [Lentisphaeria bacterium]|nr:LptF/LptG family permease [Lentisphaeria bacterium]
MHIFREFILPLGCSLVAFSLLFLLNDVFDDVSDFSGKGVPGKVIFFYFLCKLPLNLVHVIPISVLLATSFMTIMLGKNNELYAMRSAGLSLAVCALPVWLTAFLCSLVIWGISEKAGPFCQQAVSEIQQQWLETRSDKQAAPMVFQYPAEGRSWFFSSFSPEGKSQGVVVRQSNPDGGTAWVLSCRQAEFLKDRWLFQQGEIYHFKLDADQKPQRGLPEKFLRREEFFVESPAQIHEQSKPLENLNIRDIRVILRSGLLNSIRSENRLWAMFWHRLTFPLASLVGAMLGFSLSLGNGRSGYMKGFATAIGLLVLFFILGQFFLVLGKNGWVPPFVAGAFLPLAFFFAGTILVYQRQ